MIRLAMAMAPLYFNYNVDLKNLSEKHYLGVGEDLSSNVDFFLTDPAYSVSMIRIFDHAEYDVVTQNDMKGTPEVLGDVMKPIVPATYSARFYNVPSDMKRLLWNKEEQASTME